MENSNSIGNWRARIKGTVYKGVGKVDETNSPWWNVPWLVIAGSCYQHYIWRGNVNGAYQNPEVISVALGEETCKSQVSKHSNADSPQQLAAKLVLKTQICSNATDILGNNLIISESDVCLCTISPMRNTEWTEKSAQLNGAE